VANILGKFFGRTVGEGAGVAIGTAASNAVRPPLQNIANTMQESFANQPLSPGDAAAAEARSAVKDYGGVPLGKLETAREAAYRGIRSERFRVLVEMARRFPGSGELLDLLQRGQARGTSAGITTAQFRDALRRSGFTPEWIDKVELLANDLLSPATVANAVQQGHLPNSGASGRDILPPQIPEKPGINPDSAQGPDYDIPLTTIDLDPEAEASASGLDFSRLQVEANLSGLPPAQEDLLMMWRRGIITKEAVIAGIREGHTKTKWIPAVLAMKRTRLQAQEYANAWLREWITPEEAEEGARATGITKKDLDLLYLNRGRPAAPGQMWTAWARKVIGPRGVPTDYQDHEEAIRRSNIRPEYAKMLWGIRFYFPPLFQLNRLVQARAIDTDTAADWAEKNRTAPEVITALRKYWDSLGGSTTDPFETKARNQLWTTLHSSYLSAETSLPDATKNLDVLGLSEAATSAVLGLWTVERDLVRKQLTAAQIKKAWLKPVVNKATGRAWTREDAVSALVARGYNYNDANTFLDE
jgi:hypothetical protein